MAAAWRARAYEIKCIEENAGDFDMMLDARCVMQHRGKVAQQMGDDGMGWDGVDIGTSRSSVAGS